jgi:LppP/LprE lipoprotein
MNRMLTWLSVAGAVIMLLSAAAGAGAALAQAEPVVSGVSAGSLKVTGPTWNFDADLAAGGPWTSVIVTNLSSCARPLPIPGTAQAGAIVFTAQLTPLASQTPQTVDEGDLLPLRGSSGSGYVTLITQPPPVAATHVDAGLFGLDSFALDNTFTVCLVSGPGTPSAAGAPPSLANQVFSDMRAVLAMKYDVSGVVTTFAPDGSSFIGISGIPIGSADGGGQWVFFFTGTTYLGTDTAVPSSFLAFAGSPGPGQIAVSYTAYAPADPLCCPTLPPVTITYTWDGAAVTPNGTPPGH